MPKSKKREAASQEDIEFALYLIDRQLNHYDAGSDPNDASEKIARARPLIEAAPKMLDALNYALGVLESLSNSAIEQLENFILDEDIDFKRIKSAIKSAKPGGK